MKARCWLRRSVDRAQEPPVTLRSFNVQIGRRILSFSLSTARLATTHPVGEQ